MAMLHGVLKQFRRFLPVPSSSKLLCNGAVAQNMVENTDDRIVWLDMEMTGLDPNTCHILEIACLITDSNLKILSDDLNIIVHQPDAILDNMNDWCMNQHSKTGLITASRSSNVTLKDAEHTLMNFLSKYVSQGKCPLAGNTVYMDRLFLKTYMPHVDDYIHYRIIDVSTIKELTRRWDEQVYNSAPKKECNHRALDDIKESIQELGFYKSNVFRNHILH